MGLRPPRSNLSQLTIVGLIYLGLALLLVWTGACAPRKAHNNPRTHRPQDSKPVNLEIGSPAPAGSGSGNVMRLSPSLPVVSGTNRPTGVVRFETPVIEPPKANGREVIFRVEVVSETGRVPVVLSGAINSAGRFNLDEERPSANGAPIRAIGQCLDLTDCRQLYVDIFYVENGQHRRQQFQYMGGTTTATEASPVVGRNQPAPSAGENPAPAPAKPPSQRCDEFQGCEGEFVGHAVDEPYYETLRDWRGPQPRAGSPAPREGQTGSGGEAPQVPAPAAAPGAAPPAPAEAPLPRERGGPPSERVPPDPAPAPPAASLSVEEEDLRTGAQSVGLPYTICWVPCAQGTCLKQVCGRRDTNRQFGALSEGSQGPNFIELGGGPGFEKLNPERQNHYGSGLLVRLLEKSAQSYREQFDPRSVLQINDMSKRNGGPLGRHASHQNGLDADIAYLAGNPGWRSVLERDGKLIEGFEVERNMVFFKLLVDSGHVNRIFVDREVKNFACKWAKENNQLSQYRETLLRLRHYPGHHDHFHLRLHCSRHYPLCRDQQPPTDLDCP